MTTDLTPPPTAAGRCEPALLRHVLGHYPPGVVAVTATNVAGAPVGMAVGSFGSVSLDPPLVSFLTHHRSTTWPHIRAAGSFCANVLTTHQHGVRRALARRGGDKFADLAFTPSPVSGSPLLDGVGAWLDCRIADIYPAGDHDIVIGAVHALDVARHAQPPDPLTFLGGGYVQLAAAEPQRDR